MNKLIQALGLACFFLFDGLLIYSLWGIFTLFGGGISFDAIGFFAGLLWLSLGVMGYFSYVCFRVFIGYKPSFNNKHITIVAIIFFVFGFSLNYANYYFVIEPNNMMECPKKIGYKKNLMRDYVKDISQCEKF